MDIRIKQLVRDNRGVRLAVWLVLAGSAGPLLAVDIAGEIGCHRDSVSDALRAMERDGYTAALGSGRHPRWTLTDKARQLPLPGLELPGGSDYVDAEKFLVTSPVVVVDLDLDRESDEHGESQQQQQPSEAEKFRVTAPRSDLEQVLAELTAAGILEPTRSQLAADLWVTVDRVRRTAKAARRTNGRAGVMVLNLRGHVEPPRDPDEERDVGREWSEYLKRRRHRAMGNQADEDRGRELLRRDGHLDFTGEESDDGDDG